MTGTYVVLEAAKLLSLEASGPKVSDPVPLMWRNLNMFCTASKEKPGKGSLM